MTAVTSTALYRGYISTAPVVEVRYRSEPQGVSGHSNSTASLIEVLPWQRRALRAIAALGDLPNNWDGYGSRPPDRSVREWVSRLVLKADVGTLAEPEFSPESDGGLQMNWWSGHHREAEFHFEPGKSGTFLRVENGSPVDEGAFAQSDEETFKSVLNWLRRG